jgi:hypothetical protein
MKYSTSHFAHFSLEKNLLSWVMVATLLDANIARRKELIFHPEASMSDWKSLYREIREFRENVDARIQQKLMYRLTNKTNTLQNMRMAIMTIFQVQLYLSVLHRIFTKETFMLE